MKSAPTRGAHAAHDLDRQPHAVFDAAAPAVAAVVGARAQELVQQIAFAAHDLDAVVAGALRQPGAAHVVGDGAQDAALGQRARLEHRDRRLQRRGRDHQRLVAVASGVQDLHRDLAAFLMHGGGQAAVIAQVEGTVQGAAERQQPAAAVRRNAAGDDQAGAAPGALAEVGRQLRVVVEAVFQPGVHRAHDHAVAQGGEAEVERRQQVRIVGIGHGVGARARRRVKKGRVSPGAQNILVARL